MDDFREWLSDHLRYILLGLGVILILVIAFFAVRLVTGLGSTKKNKETEAVTEAGTEVQQSEVLPEDAEVSDLVKDNPDVLNLVTKYYNARAAKDFETLKGMCETFDDSIQAEIEQTDAAIESYDNIITYSKNGPEEGTYIVYVYFDIKLTGIDTLAPTLRELYAVTDVEGNLMVGDKTEVESYLLERQADGDVQALVTDVDQKLQSAMAQDENLKNFVQAQATGSTPAVPEGSDTTVDSAEAVTGTMMATTTVNVRGTPSTDGTLYGSVMEGQQVNVLENLDSGWSKISYTASGTTIEGYVMTQYLGAVQ